MTVRSAVYYAHANKDMDNLDDDGILIFLDKDTVAHDNLTINYKKKFDFQNAESGIHPIRRLEKSKETTHPEWQESMAGLLLAAKACDGGTLLTCSFVLE